MRTTAVFLIFFVSSLFSTVGQGKIEEIQFVESDKGKPVRVSGRARATRSGVATPAIVLLVPPKKALTSSVKPILYFYRSAGTKGTMEFVLSEPGKTDPLVETYLQDDGNAGVKAISIGDFPSIQLVSGKTYLWSVSYIVDPMNRSLDVHAGSRFEVVKDSLTNAENENESLIQRARRHAKEGRWIDCLDLMFRHAKTKPSLENEKLLRSLLRQGGVNVGEPDGKNEE